MQINVVQETHCTTRDGQLINSLNLKREDIIPCLNTDWDRDVENVLSSEFLELASNLITPPPRLPLSFDFYVFKI